LAGGGVTQVVEHLPSKLEALNSNPVLPKLENKIKGSYLNVINAINDKPIANIILNGEKTENISSKIRNETRLSTLTPLVQYSTLNFSQSNKARERNKRIQVGNKKSNYSCLGWVVAQW
jgi:hypothetical protein